LEQDYARLWIGLDLLGLSQLATYDPNEMFGRMYGIVDQDQRIKDLIAARTNARTAKNFKEADRIRDELQAMGITLKDAKDPKTGELTTTWEVAR
jgi:cysteinyl-tRNA synthetase